MSTLWRLSHILDGKFIHYVVDEIGKYGTTLIFVGKFRKTFFSVDTFGPHPFIPTPTRKDARKRAHPRRRLCRDRFRWHEFRLFSHGSLVNGPSPFRRGIKG
jgi:hypothetical protein